MYQIFYIDIDEEITSVIDRLKKSKADENFFVVSTRSLILQSVVSLKLLKREATKDKKQIAIVVNDTSASMKIEKAGILVLDSLKGLEGGEEIKESFGSKMEIKDSNNKNNYKNIMEKEKGTKKTRLQKIGSDDFYSEKTAPDPKEKIVPLKPTTKTTRAKKSAYLDSPVESVSVANPSISAVNYRANLPKSKSIADISMKPEIRKEATAFSYVPETNFEESFPEPENHFSQVPKEYGPNKIGNMNELDPYKERLVEGFFNPELKKSGLGNYENQPKNTFEKSVPVSHKMRKIIVSFIMITLVFLAGVASYLFLPKATVVISTRNEVKKFDSEVKGNTNSSEMAIKDLTIPARVVEKEVSSINSFKATGKKNSTSDVSQKAKGRITIYNEYNSESQSLVATTRFLSTDGKLFRLVKGATVPGMSGSNPGLIEVDVIADQPGDEYNIAAASFKIPGFEGTPKYEKFSAKSSVAMAGGGSSGSGGITIISQSDLDSAKKDSELKMKDQLEEEVKNEIGAENILLSESSEKNILESASTGKSNEVTANFDYKVKGKIKVIVFSETSLKKLLGETYNESNKGKEISNYSLIKVTYGASSADFSGGILTIKVNVEVPVKNSINWDDFKKSMLGKNGTEIKETLKEYPQIEKINIDFWPSFMSQKIPQYEKRVTIIVKDGSN